MARYQSIFAFLLVLFIAAAPARAERVVTVSGNGTMRILANPGCAGDACEWVDIDRNGRTTSVAATQDKIFQLHDNGLIWRWKGLPCADGGCPYWAMIDNNRHSVAIVGNDDTLFQLHNNGSVWRWKGDDCASSSCASWEKIGDHPQTTTIVAAGSQLFRLHDNGEIWRWKGQPCAGANCSSWDKLDNNPQGKQIAYASRGSLFQRHANGAIWRWDGQPCGSNGCRSWTMIDNNRATVDILASPGNLFQRHGNGNVWRWEGRACDGGSCPHWKRIGANSNWRAIGAGPQPYRDDFSTADPGFASVYAATANGRVERWGGSNCSSSCQAWTDLGRGFASFSTSRGGLYVFDGNPPVRDERYVTIPPRPGDADGDGLPDNWERERMDWGLNPAVANMIVVKVLRPDLAENPALMTTLQNNLDRMKLFYANLPVMTARGARGIHVVYRDGNPLSDFYREDVENAIGYRSVRSVGMPADLIGYAHGLFIGVGTGGGGQTNGSDWSGVSNNYPTFLHELGHQLELDHEPKGHPPSPLYTSLMNYDYNYSFNNDANAIHYSRGRFAGITLNERNLNEVLPYSETELAFLEAWPYRYDVEPQDAGSASVDWNRNGIQGERSISADVNDGYALGIKDVVHAGETTGDVALAAQGDFLVAFTTQVNRANRLEYAGAGATPAMPARLGYAVVRDDTVVRTGRLTTAPIMTGAPSAVAKDGRIIVAFPGLFNTVQVGVYTIGADGSLSGTITGFNPGARREVALVDVRDTSSVQMILWDPATGEVETRRIGVGSTVTFADPEQVLLAGGTTRFRSGVAPGVTYNYKSRAMVMLSTEDSGMSTNRLKIWSLRRGTDGAWSASDPHWLSDTGARTPSRPAIVFDGSDRAGGEGRYLAYFRNYNRVGDEGSGLYKINAVRATMPETVSSDPGAPYRNRHRMYINEWTYSRNGLAVTAYKDDFAVLWRTHERYEDENARNRAEINTYASGESSAGAADFDDITHIATLGLWRSIERARPAP